MPKTKVNVSEKNETVSKKNMLEATVKKTSKQELLHGIKKAESSDPLRKTIKSPSQILQFIEEQHETIESLAKMTELSEREILLAIRDGSDTITRKKIAEALNTTYFSLFGK